MVVGHVWRRPTTSFGSCAVVTCNLQLQDVYQGLGCATLADSASIVVGATAP